MNAGTAPGPEASILKIKGTEIQQTLTDVLMRTGSDTTPTPSRRRQGPAPTRPPSDPSTRRASPPATSTGARRRSTAAATRIQRNIIAKMVLGL